VSGEYGFFKGPIIDITEEVPSEPIDDGDISFSNGYGFTELGVDDEY